MSKKIIAICLLVAGLCGVLLPVIPLVSSLFDRSGVGVIGGASAPTVAFLLGRWFSAFWIPILVGVVLAVLGIVLMRTRPIRQSD